MKRSSGLVRTSLYSVSMGAKVKWTKTRRTVDLAEFFTFLVTYGYIVIFVWVLLDQAGLPLPAIPLLLAAGVLVAGGQLTLWIVLLVTLLASVPIDYFWYAFGRWQGAKVLNLLCAISLEPDYCVRNTESVFERMGPFSLLIAKFVPGLQTLAPPMSGLTGMSTGRFLALDTIGTLIWSGTFLAIGMVFHTQLEAMAMAIAEFGFWAGFGLVVIVLGYIAAKFTQRQVFIRSLRMRRLEPEEVYEMLEHKEDTHVIDLRHTYDYDLLPEKVPSAIRVPMEAIDRHAHRIPKDSDVVLYCS